MNPRSIRIVGGGLSGLTLGIALRRRNIPVTLWEAGHYPRHKVCGEFISGAGIESLRRMQLFDAIQRAGAIEAQTVSFATAEKQLPPQTLPSAALSISRFKLDQMLAQEFRSCGGDLRESSRWTGKYEDGVVRATGRAMHAISNGWRWFGLKVHADGVDLNTDLEMHFGRNGYVGICRLDGGRVNVCGLFRSRQVIPDLKDTWRDWLCGAPSSLLRQRLQRARFVEDSFCSVAALQISSDLAAMNEFAVGDSTAMIAPLTGNGMSMAFESAEIAIEPLVRYAVGQHNWNEARRELACVYHRRFRERLRWAHLTQKIAFLRPLTQSLAFACLRGKWMLPILFRRTR